MLFSIGTRVKLVHTRDEGVVTELLDNGMVNVLLDDNDFEIPVFPDDLARVEDLLKPKPPVKAKFVQGKLDKSLQAPKRPPVESQYTILKSYGIQLAFDPVLGVDGYAKKYRIYLINDTPYDALFTFELYIAGLLEMRHNSVLSHTSIFELGELLFDQLNDNPEVRMDCWRITTQGTSSKMHKTLRIKPKLFFKKTRTAPFLNKQVHLFRLFESLKDKIDPRKEDLKTYTQKNTRPKSSWLSPSSYMPHEVLELAEFSPEMDLHIEQLTDKYHKLSNSEILRIQLQHFDEYIEKAIRLGVDRVFIIHGIGKGRLRDAISSRLLQLQEVRSFRNEFHPRYGYGATEVIF
jgi:hypothetical protein